MKKERTSAVRRVAWVIAAAILILTAPTAPLFAQQITEIFAGTQGLNAPKAVAVDSADNVYVAGTGRCDPACGGCRGTGFKIAPDGTITQIFDSGELGSVAVDSAGNVYVPGQNSNNVFKIALGEAPPPLCDGDCNGDGEITVDEVITGVNIALGNISVCECMPCDTDEDGAISIEELIRAVHQALTGCPFWNGDGGDQQGSAAAWIESMRERCEEREEAAR